MKFFSSIKNTVCFSFVVFYFAFSFFNAIITFSTFKGLLYSFADLVPLALILCYLLFEQKDYKLKNFMFPLAFGIIVYRSLYGVIAYFDGLSRFTILEIEIEVEIIFAFIIVAALFNILCFCGTLFNFKLSILLKIGCIGYILTTIIMPIYEFISLGGMEYLNTVPEDISPINITALAKLLSIVLFYIAIFVYSIDKKHSDLV